MLAIAHVYVPQAQVPLKLNVYLYTFAITLSNSRLNEINRKLFGKSSVIFQALFQVYSMYYYYIFFHFVNIVVWA